MKLTKKDYITILQFYKIDIPKSTKLLKKYAEKIMAKKLCKCIKSVESVDESRAIGICTRTIFNNKGYTRGEFTCKKNQTVKLIKKQNKKTRRNSK
jgi:hypothetical protein